MVLKEQANNLLKLLQCPKCSSQRLEAENSTLQCQNCQAAFSMINDVPVFLDNPSTVKILSPDHTSNPIPKYVFEWLKQLDGYSLNIGAGASQTKLPNSIEMEYAIFKNTDVIADAHALPFQDAAFDAVVALNVFEHLSEPTVAAKEIFRVLKPGGKVIIHTAFLQPLHEEPFHFFNATKYGVMKWFSDFDIQCCQVSENLNPAFTIAWLSSELLRLTEQVYGKSISEKVAQTTIADWAKLWVDPASREGLMWEVNRHFPQDIQERFAAGFELEAVKPTPENVHNGNGHRALVCPAVESFPQQISQLLIAKPSTLPPAPPAERALLSADEIAALLHEPLYEPTSVKPGKHSIDAVKLFVTSLGNHFMIEIAYIYAEGFSKNGLTTEVAIDKIPSIDPRPGLMQIVIAPHEYFNLFLDHKLTPAEVKDVVQAVYMLSAEQPYSPWFEMVCQRSQTTRGILDITAQTTHAYRERKLTAMHLPLGYASIFEAGVTEQHRQHRPIDLLFLGSWSRKREQFVAKHNAFFNRHNSQITITRLEKPKFAQTPGFYANEQRNQLLSSSKIIINVHAVENTYFEWLRVMMAIANGCLFVTEVSDHIEPLINHKHLVMVSLDEIPERCEYYLTHESERLKIVNRAYDFVTRYYSSERICASLLSKLQTSNHFFVQEKLP